jgi:hypothetical protein
MIQLPRSLEATAQFIGGPEMRDVKSIARFPEPQYWNGNFALEIEGFGHGSSLAIATNRAFREIMSDPRMRYKCPNSAANNKLHSAARNALRFLTDMHTYKHMYIHTIGVVEADLSHPRCGLLGASSVLAFFSEVLNRIESLSISAGMASFAR